MMNVLMKKQRSISVTIRRRESVIRWEVAWTALRSAHRQINKKIYDCVCLNGIENRRHLCCAEKTTAQINMKPLTNCRKVPNAKR